MSHLTTPQLSPQVLHQLRVIPGPIQTTPPKTERWGTTTTHSRSSSNTTYRPTCRLWITWPCNGTPTRRPRSKDMQTISICMGCHAGTLDKHWTWKLICIAKRNATPNHQCYISYSQNACPAHCWQPRHWGYQQGGGVNTTAGICSNRCWNYGCRPRISWTSQEAWWLACLGHINKERTQPA